MTDSELIATITPANPSVCACAACRHLCTVTPCIGTPDDIARLLTNGLQNVIGIPSIEMVQIRALHGNACPLYVDGQCVIHPIKPTSGKLASHVPSPLRQNPDVAVALTWAAAHNSKLVAILLSLFP